MELVILNKARQAIAEARRIDEVKDIRDKAEAVRLIDARQLPTCPGIYIAELGGETLYVGRAMNLRKRWIGHHRKSRLTALGNDVILRWIPCAPEYLNEYEKLFISVLQPSLNDQPMPLEATPEQKRRSLTGMQELFGNDFMLTFFPHWYESCE